MYVYLLNIDLKIKILRFIKQKQKLKDVKKFTHTNEFAGKILYKNQITVEE